MNSFCASPKRSLLELAARVASMVLLSCVSLWVIAVVAIRVHLFHAFYIHHLQTVEDEKWLRVQCDDPVFFSNLKQHVSLCAQVQENAQRNALLVALTQTMENSSLCGVVSCWDLVMGLQHASLNTMLMLSACAILMVAVLLPCANIVTRFLCESSPKSFHYSDSSVVAYRESPWPRYASLDVADSPPLDFQYGKKLV